MAAITLQQPRLLLLLPVAGLLFLALAWRRRFRPLGPFLLRLFMLALVVLALARPVRVEAEPSDTQLETERLVILADQSASLGAARARVRSAAARLARSASDAEVLFFADRPVPVNDPLQGTPVAPDQTAIPSSLDPDYTNLADALSAGAELLGIASGRLVLLSDGVATVGDTWQAVADLVQRDIPVDVGRVPAQMGGDDVRVVDVSLPPRLRQGETFAVEIVVYSGSPATALLSLSQDGAPIAEDRVALEPGLNRFHFERDAADVGPHTFQAQVMLDAGQDDVLLNNLSGGFTQIFPPPRILVVGQDLLENRRFARQVEQAGFLTASLPPSDLPDRLSDLEAFAGMLFLDVSARALRLEQMVAVQEYVRSLGRGLLVTGGLNSYSLGEYEDTPLAELLPVSLEPPPREERPPVALLLVIDHSGSMQGGLPTKLTMAKEAALRATDILGPEDLIGVLIFDHLYEWIVPFQQVSDGADFLALQQRIATIPQGGGTRVLEALQAALPALAEQAGELTARHAVLLTDGQSFDGPDADERYAELIDQAREADITLSTIAIGIDADEALLARLAERGQGRYHFAARPEELPALTIAESAILSGNALQEGEFLPAVSMPHPLLRGLFPVDAQTRGGTLPKLLGYVGLTPKPRAETPLQVGPGDPLLSVWGYGLGRVAAWTSDTGSQWAGEWVTWSGAERFWGQLVEYTLPAPDLGLLQLETEIGPESVVTLMVDAVTATGQPVDLVPTTASLTTPAGRTVDLNLLQVAPGRYQQTVRLPDPGAYVYQVSQPRSNGSQEDAVSGFILPYPAEYNPPAEPVGHSLLGEIAAATGGRVLDLEDVAAVTPASSAARAAAAPPVPQPLWPWPVLLALLLWPVEIAWRKWSRLRIQ